MSMTFFGRKRQIEDSRQRKHGPSCSQRAVLQQLYGCKTAMSFSSWSMDMTDTSKAVRSSTRSSTTLV